MGSVLTPLLFFAVFLPFVATIANDKHLCGGNGWAPFPETRCIKLFPQIGDRSHKWAKRFCASEDGGARLVTVQSAAEQAALEQFLNRQNPLDLATLKYLWLDGSDEQYDPNNTYNSSVFSWGQNEEENPKNLSSPLNFTNWALGQPVMPPPLRLENTTCIQMHAFFGKWSNEPCSRKNAVVCVRKQRWSLEKVQEVVENLVPLGFRLEKMQEVIERQYELNEKMQKEMQMLTKNPVPLGFIYVQLPKEKSPQEIWPSAEIKWTDISSSYESTFFRVAGRQAAPFGKVQEDFSPFIDRVQYSPCRFTWANDLNNCSTLLMNKWDVILDRQSPRSWSGRVLTAGAYKSFLNEWPDENTYQETATLQFHSVGGEVRPRNMAVKVWKRIG